MMRLTSLALRTTYRSSLRCFATISFPTVQPIFSGDQPYISAEDKLHQLIERYRQTHFPETVPHEFVDQVLCAADENKDGLISVNEMTVLLRNLYSHQQIMVDEVRFIMERDLDMPENTDAVPMEKVKRLLLEIHT